MTQIEWERLSLLLVGCYDIWQANPGAEASARKQLCLTRDPSSLGFLKPLSEGRTFADTPENLLLLHSPMTADLILPKCSF